MRPIDAISVTDEETIQNYISIYGDAECGPKEFLLREWDKNKTTLFKALGRKLSVKKTITLPKNQSLINAEINSIYRSFIINYDADINMIKNDKEFLFEQTQNDFITDVIFFWVNQNYCLEDLRILTSLFRIRNISEGYITRGLLTSVPYHFHDFKCTVKNGMKTMRTIQKVLKATKYPNINLFEKWRDQVNLVQMNDGKKATLVISINPIDFMTMSDNTCNWSSCMSWTHHGCYHAGTLEMMNSNVVAVAYLQAPSNFDLQFSETGEVFSIPNKSWRALVYIHKDIILVGKSYPYNKKDISIEVLKMVKELVKKNLNWDYQFNFQQYRDMDYISGNYFVRDWYNVFYDKKKEHHSIFFYTNGMYNDIIEDHYTNFYCCRNYVKRSKKICLSGPATCICCGQRLDEHPRESIYNYDDLGQDKICYDCKRTRCTTCGKVSWNNIKTSYGTFCSEECMKDMVVFYKLPNKPACKKDNLVFGRNSYVVLFMSEDMTAEDVGKIRDDFYDTRSEDINMWVNELRKHYPAAQINKVPAGLSGYQFANVNRWYTYVSTPNYDCKYELLVYPYDPEYAAKQEKIKNLAYRKPLIDLLKGE